MNSKPQRLLLAFGLAALMTVAGCGYGPVSPTAYEYSKALYSLSNRQAADRIDSVQAQIDQSQEAGELPPHEADWLRDICDDCRAARWEQAQAAARRMMQDQVRS
ncbi:hypothetical protein MalM25_27370 [Planctomycetes bacterium MalM25]|nr:hypothetical protein MalM25_27370 [Planctomycetes bacterium MalM25]